LHSNQVKNNVCTTIKQGENSNKQNAKEMQQVLSLRLVPDSKKEVAKTTQARSNGVADWREASQVNTDTEGVETEVGVIPNLSKYVYGRCFVKHHPKWLYSLEKYFFWHVPFAKIQGAYVDTQNWHLVDQVGRPVP
jgi:hypothetical protein